LLGLKSTARKEGDYYIINGQKSCSSGAHVSDWVLLLSTTDTTAPRGKGLSLFVVNKALPGITVNPVINLEGVAKHNNVFFEDVKVHKDYLIGELNSGLRLMFAGLQSDRFWGRCVKPHFLDRVLGEFVAFLRSDPLGQKIISSNPWAREALADLRIEIEMSRLLSLDCVSKLHRGIKLVYEASNLKLFSEEVGVRLFHTIVNLMGPYGILKESSRFPFASSLWRYYLSSIPYTVAGGTAEIQRDTIARFGLTARNAV